MVLEAARLPQRAAAAAEESFPDAAEVSKLNDEKKGHQDKKFSPAHSFNWGIPYLIHRTNAAAGDQTYKCGDVSRARLIEGAVQYNGGGDDAYRKKIENALKLIGDIESTSDVAEASTPSKTLAVDALEELLAGISGGREALAKGVDALFGDRVLEVAASVTTEPGQSTGARPRTLRATESFRISIGRVLAHYAVTSRS